MKDFRILLLVLALLSASCATDRQISRGVRKMFKKSTQLESYNVGFALFNPQTRKTLYTQNEHRYFTPASNTKLFTFYAALKILKDSMPSLRYVEQGDSLIFWGTGDPAFLHSQLKDQSAYNFLKQHPSRIYFSPGRYTGPVMGAGWSWDDYNDYYQAEINELPLFDNLVAIDRADNGKLQIRPRLFSDCFVLSPITKGDFGIRRELTENTFHVPDSAPPKNFSQQVPFKVSTPLTLNLLADTLGKPVFLADKKMPAYARRIMGAPRDSVLKAMMLPSDNFIAEQLLLTIADQAGLEMDARPVINHIVKTYLAGLPDKPQWADGSGLSRMNLFTPADMIHLLDLIWREFPDKAKLFALLPAGGQSGTLKNAYARTNSPFVFGKTGSLSNIHNQSGYIITKKGHTLFFSFMNNNFLQPTAEVRKEMVRIMTLIHEKY